MGQVERPRFMSGDIEPTLAKSKSLALWYLQIASENEENRHESLFRQWIAEHPQGLGGRPSSRHRARRRMARLHQGRYARPGVSSRQSQRHGAGAGGRRFRAVGIERHQYLSGRHRRPADPVSRQSAGPGRHHPLAVLGTGALQQGAGHHRLPVGRQTGPRAGRTRTGT